MGYSKRGPFGNAKTCQRRPAGFEIPTPKKGTRHAVFPSLEEQVAIEEFCANLNEWERALEEMEEAATKRPGLPGHDTGFLPASSNAERLSPQAGQFSSRVVIGGTRQAAATKGIWLARP